MQTDEKHWVLRAHVLGKRLVRFSEHFSRHLGHPGVFPAAVLMSGQAVGKAYNKAAEIITGHPGTVSLLTGARLGNAAFSSLLPCLVFLFLLRWTGVGEAFCVGALIALGPRMIDLSQIAHVDTIFSVVVTLTVMAYVSALRLSNSWLKLAAGILFGFCILSKPTALALIPAFMLSKALLRWRWPQTYKEAPLVWSDVWLALSSLVVFVLGYTRMWHHRKPYPEWGGIDRTIPDYLFTIGEMLSSGVYGIALGILVVGVLWSMIRHLNTRTPLSGIEHVLALTTTLATCLALMPQAFENLSLYFMRVFALQSVQHVTFHGATPPIPGGYMMLASVDLPPLVLLAILCAPFLLIPKIRKSLSSSEQQLLVVASVVTFVWILFLSTSSKQAWRYALPVVPQLYLIACFILCALGRAIEARRIPILLLLLGQVKAVYRAYPHWDLYQSPFAPPPHIAYQIGVFHPRTGQTDALRFFIEESVRTKRKLRITVFGDGKMLTREAARSFGKYAGLISLGYFPEDKADFILVQGNMKVKDPILEKYLSAPPVFVARAKDVAIASVYRVTFSKLSEPAPSTSVVP